MQEVPIIIYIVKKYLWELMLGAICLTMVHNAIENLGGTARWAIVSKAVVNGLYASIFFSGLGGYYFNEIGLIGGILIGATVGLAGVKEFVNIFLDSLKNKIR